MSRTRFPSSFYNLISVIGAGLALFAVAAFIILFVLELFADHPNPYLGILTFMVFPAVLVIGLLLIPIGMRWETRRRARGAAEPVVVDLSRPQHRNALIVFIAGTSVFLLLTTVGIYGGYEYSESVEFCGQVCHQVMEPEFVAYHESPHARVKCVTCHIGPGADWYVRSKFSGARQVFKTIQGSYPTPIPTPIENLRPAREVCEQCHWPGKFGSEKAMTWDYFLGDEENTHWQMEVLVHVGGISPRGEAVGSHWHVDRRIVYVASDESRQDFDQVIWYRDGEAHVYTRDGKALPDTVLAHAREEGLERTMDCIDCHNRPAHRYRSPMEMVDAALTSGRIDPDIPWIKRRAVEVLSKRYHTSEGARDSIALHLNRMYEVDGVDLPEGTVDAVLGAFEKNFFPHMDVRWSVYPDNSGHLEFPGCFRCHGSDLQTASGEGISDDCNLCHTIVSQGPVHAQESSHEGLQFKHPIDIDGAEREMHCTDCHFGDAGVYLPVEVERAQADREVGGS